MVIIKLIDSIGFNSEVHGEKQKAHWVQLHLK